VDSALTEAEGRIYDLVCRRLLQCWHREHVSAITTVITGTQTNSGAQDLWVSKGVVVIDVGWKALEVRAAGRDGKMPGDETTSAMPAGLATGTHIAVQEARVQKKKTRAPARFTEASLLTAMESAGQSIEEKELSEAMKERGLGTPATRAAIIEVLIQRQYITREGKALVSTPRGREVIARVDTRVKSPVLTGEWEAYLRRIERTEGSLDRFITGIERFVTEIVGSVKHGNLQPLRNVVPLATAGAERSNASGKQPGRRKRSAS
jgi:DNA topoisomerase-3